jgi:hypothetical protein
MWGRKDHYPRTMPALLTPASGGLQAAAFNTWWRQTHSGRRCAASHARLKTHPRPNRTEHPLPRPRGHPAHAPALCTWMPSSPARQPPTANCEPVTPLPANPGAGPQRPALPLPWQGPGVRAGTAGPTSLERVEPRRFFTMQAPPRRCRCRLLTGPLAPRPTLQPPPLQLPRPPPPV